MKSKAFKMKTFVAYLSSVEEFEQPKIELEQYMTPPDITANLFSILHVIYHDSIKTMVV